MQGFQDRPSMVAIVVLEIAEHYTTNEECFCLRRDIEMNTLLQ